MNANLDHPVVEVIDESDGELVYAFRIRGREFTPTVRSEGTYTVRVIDRVSGQVTESEGLRAVRQ